MSPISLIHGGSASDPQFNDPLLHHLSAALHSCGAGSQIELCVSFIRHSGLNLLLPALKSALARGAHLRVITSDYMAITEPVALRALLTLDSARCQHLIYQSQGNVGFHLKAYLFVHHGEPLQGQAFLGSSNISQAALTESLEWNMALRTDKERGGEVRTQLQALQRNMDELARDPRVCPLTPEWIDAYGARYRQLANQPLIEMVTGDKAPNERPIPNSVQHEALLALAQTRRDGFSRGLVVLATGLGKTYLAAFDAQQLQARRILFVAHREEILQQAHATFARVSPERRGGFYQGQTQELHADALFASVQTLSKTAHLRRFAPDHFDYIVVDEFHHADAHTYRRLLAHFQPRFLLGLTATPERSDNADILALCDANLVFARHLAEAIELNALVPLHYHGILDEHVDYAQLPWPNGQFDPKALEFAFASQKRAQHALHVWQRLKQSRTLAFCISQRHADFMAEYFCAHGVPAAAVHGASALSRQTALAQFAAGDVEILFSVDLFNEGTDIPSLDTVLMLRATQSSILFLQQLGRGLRLHPGKSHLVAIDLVGNHTKCLDRPKFIGQTLTPSSQPMPERPWQTPTLAGGCFINLDPALIAQFEQRLAAATRDPASTAAAQPNALARTLYRRYKMRHGSRPS
ncbi:MAG: DEAD/DEAH box helicase family protein, partial [Aeromonas sp.]